MIPTNGPKKDFVQSWEQTDLADESILGAFDPVIEVGHRFAADDADEAEQESLLDELPEAVVFDLGATLRSIPNKLFFRIGEVGELLGLKTYVLRFWETEFPMIQPSKSKTGQRVYRKKDVELLCLIKHLLYVERFSIEGAKKKIRELKREGGLNPSLIAHGRVAPASQPAPAASAPTPATPAQLGLSPEKKAELQAELESLQLLTSRPLTELFRY